jgi:tetratricopeptide (TPR) repeat protein
MSTCLRIAISAVAMAVATVPGVLARGDGGGFGRLGGYHGGSSYGGYTGTRALNYDGGYGYRQTPGVAAPTATEPAISPEAAGDEPSAFDTDAISALRQGRYADSARLASRAADDRPSDPNAHLLLMLGSFAVGQYRGAAAEAHVVASLGQMPDWPKIYAIYGNVDTYTRQLRALEKFAAKTPSAAEGRFLLGFQYAMLGHQGAARSQFLAALKIAPQDRLAAELLVKQGGAVPPQIAARQRESKPVVVKN